MEKEQVTGMLDRLSDLRAAREEIGQPVRAQIAELETELKAETAPLTADIEALEGEIRSAVLTLAESVKGRKLLVIYQPPKITWHTEALEGFAASHPEILRFRRVGKAAAIIQAIRFRDDASKNAKL